MLQIRLAVVTGQIKPIILPLRQQPVIHKFTLDHTSHMNYGLSYPMTYIFSIPADSTNLKAYKYENTWIQIPNQNRV